MINIYTEKEPENWLDAMIEREATPKTCRTDTIEEFCKKWGISERTYGYQSAKPDNWKKILQISLSSAKKECPEILGVLAEKAKSGDVKAINSYLDYVLQLAKNLDIKTDGQALKYLVMPAELIEKNNIEKEKTI